MNTALFYGKKKKALIPPVESEDDFSSEDSLADENYKPSNFSDESSSDSISTSSENSESFINSQPVQQSSTVASSSGTHTSGASDASVRSICNVPKRVPIWKVNSGVEHLSPPWLDDLPPNNTLLTPYQYFKKIADNDLMQLIVDQSNLYARHVNVASNFNLSITKLEQFLGICFYMSLIQIPGTRRYWNSQYGLSQVYETMSRVQWEEVKRYLHFSDNLGQNSDDKLWKIRPVSDHIKNNLKNIPREQCLCVDEQVVPFKGKSGLKQYNPKKPKKWGYKIFCLCGASGIIYDFEIYSGSVVQPPHLPDIGASANVVLRMTETIPKLKNFQLFFDNWFCNMQLLIELAKIGIFAVATVRPNRIQNHKLPSDNELKKKGRGAFVEKTTRMEDIDIFMVKWHDNRCVNLISTFSGAFPVSEIKRFDRKNHQNVMVSCPAIVKVYNSFMGGVDLLDSLIALYRTKIRSKKYYFRLFFHLMDMVCVTSWLLYRRDCDDCGISKKKQLSLFDFKMDIAQSLCWAGKKRKYGRPRSSDSYDQRKPRKRATCSPDDDSRYDNLGHWMEYDEKANRCKVCGKVTKAKCMKCKTHACIVPERNCFFEFHNK